MVLTVSTITRALPMTSFAVLLLMVQKKAYPMVAGISGK